MWPINSPSKIHTVSQHISPKSKFSDFPLSHLCYTPTLSSLIHKYFLPFTPIFPPPWINQLSFLKNLTLYKRNQYVPLPLIQPCHVMWHHHSKLNWWSNNTPHKLSQWFFLIGAKFSAHLINLLSLTLGNLTYHPQKYTWHPHIFNNSKVALGQNWIKKCEQNF